MRHHRRIDVARFELDRQVILVVHRGDVEQRRLWQIAENEALEAVAQAGVEISRPDKSLFIEKTQGLLKEYESDPTLYSLIQDIQAIK